MGVGGQSFGKRVQSCAAPAPTTLGSGPAGPLTPWLGRPSPLQPSSGTLARRSPSARAGQADAHTHSLQCVRVFLQEGHSRWGVAGHVLVGEVHELVDEGRQVAGRLPVALQSSSLVFTARAPPPCPPHLPRSQDGPRIPAMPVLKMALPFGATGAARQVSNEHRQQPATEKTALSPTMAPAQPSAEHAPSPGMPPARSWSPGRAAGNTRDLPLIRAHVL